MILIRSLIFAAVFYALSTVISILMLPTLILPRQVCQACISLWGRLVIVLLRLICGVRVEVRGRQFLPKGAALVAAKHQCMLDTAAPFAVMPNACFAMKKELFSIPFYGWYSVKSGMIKVDREGHAKAMKQLMADARDRIAHDRQIVIFPEGTRRDPGAPPAYKPGVAGLYRELGVACTPMATNSGVHWPAHGFIRRPGTVVFEFLEPIPAGMKRAAFMAELEKRIETASNALLASGL